MNGVDETCFDELCCEKSGCDETGFNELGFEGGGCDETGYDEHDFEEGVCDETGFSETGCDESGFGEIGDFNPRRTVIPLWGGFFIKIVLFCGVIGALPLKLLVDMLKNLLHSGAVIHSGTVELGFHPKCMHLQFLQ
ncbi:hypothetical protein L6452_43312 [Arctium lappa]|uniref:Uncharacterized protein n=1 Tax=Arctium lappa TaxID=4217 RepID=A0ACB8XMH0_ARCLA|nr:hypothetical protein L6452_43312 [Arctium lappa]